MKQQEQKQQLQPQPQPEAVALAESLSKTKSIISKALKFKTTLINFAQKFKMIFCRDLFIK